MNPREQPLQHVAINVGHAGTYMPVLAIPDPENFGPDNPEWKKPT